MGGRAVVRLPCASGTHSPPPFLPPSLDGLPPPRPLRPVLPCSLPLKCSEPSECFHRQVGRTPPPPKCCHLLSPSFFLCEWPCRVWNGWGREGGRERGHGLFQEATLPFLAFLPSFLPPLTLSPYSRSSPRSPPCLFQMRSESNLRHPRAHPPLPDKSVVLPCTFPATEGGREGHCAVAFGGTLALRRRETRMPRRLRQY